MAGARGKLAKGKVSTSRPMPNSRKVSAQGKQAKKTPLKVGGSIAQFKRVKGSAASIGTPPTAGVQ